MTKDVEKAVAFLPAEPGIMAYLVEQFWFHENGKRKWTIERQTTKYRLCGWSVKREVCHETNTEHYGAWPVLNTTSGPEGASLDAIHSILLVYDNGDFVEMYEPSTSGLSHTFHSIDAADRAISHMNICNEWEVEE